MSFAAVISVFLLTNVAYFTVMTVGEMTASSTVAVVSYFKYNMLYETCRLLKKSHQRFKDPTQLPY